MKPRAAIRQLFIGSALLTVTHSQAQTTRLWNNNGTSNIAWLGTGNWSPSGTFAGGAPLANPTGEGANTDIMGFATANTGTTAGINMNTLAAGGNVGLVLGGIDLTRTSANAFQIGNSSSTVSGILQLNGATINSVANTLIRVNSGDMTITNVATGATNGGQTLGLRLGNTNGIFNVETSRTLTIVSQISEATSGSGFTKTGAGILSLSGSNTYTGATTLSGGTIILNNATALGGNNPGVNGTSSISMAAGTTLRSNYTITDAGIVDSYVYAPITLTGTGTANFHIGAGSSTAPAESVRLNLNGAIGGTAGTDVVFSTSSGTLNNADSIFVLGAASTYDGNTTITTGNSQNRINVIAGVANALPTTTVLTMDSTVGNGTGRTAQYDLNGNNQTLTGLTNGGVVPNFKNQRINNTGTLATLTINNTADFTFGGSTTATNGSGTSTARAQLQGNLALTKSGSGTFTLGGTLTGGATAGGNTHTGATTILGGTLVLGETLSLQNSPLDTANSVAGDASNGLRTTVTSLRLGGLTGNKDFADVFTTTSGGYDGLTALTLNPGTGATYTYSGNIGDGATGMTLSKFGAGTQILSGTNTYTGTTSIALGTLGIGTDNALATGAMLSGTAGAGNTATFDLRGFNQTVAGLAGNIPAGTNVVTNSGTADSTLTLSALTAERGSGFNIQDGATNKVSLVYDNANTANAQRLYVASTYSGGTTIKAGRLNAEHSNALGTAGVTLEGTTAHLRLTGNSNLSIGSGNSLTVSDTGDAKILSGTGLVTGLNHSFAGNVTINETTVGNFEIQVGVDTTLTINGSVTGTGGAGIKKTSTGTLILNNANNDYAGDTQVNSGTLLINGNVSTSNVTVNAGTLGGTGTIAGGITLNSGGTLSPGASIESLASGSNTWNGGSTFVFEFSTDGSTGTAGIEWDLLSITGGLDLSGATVGSPINFNLVTMANASSSGLLAAWDPDANATWAGFVTTTTGFTDFDSNKFAINTSAFQNTFSGSFSVVQNGNNLDLVYTAVPEPRAALLGAIGALLLLRRRR